MRYGTRVRNKQKKEVHQVGESDKGKEDESNMETNSKQLDEEQETEPTTKGATGLYMQIVVLYYAACVTGGDVPLEDKVPDSWDREAASSEEVNRF